MNNNQRFALTWGIVSFIIAAIIVTHNTSPMVVLASFGAKVFAAIVGTIFGLAGAAIGEAFRRFALPDRFFTTGGMTSIIKTKLFWMVGPQIIGMLIGVFLGAALVLM